VSWSSVLLAFLVSHLAGDFLLQTEFQATRKKCGLGSDPVARRALLMHVLTYTLAFVPVLLWIGGSLDAGKALGAAALVAIPHLLVDDGRFVYGWMRAVKHSEPQEDLLKVAVDQSFHAVCLLGAALLTTA
jgi:Protein of unknown function (DUF3307)